MPVYVVNSKESRVMTHARSRIHDTRTEWDKVEGEIHADPENLREGKATARLTVDMRSFDAGDRIKNKKLRKDFEVDAHPEAVFELTSLEGVADRPNGGFNAVAHGYLRWREYEIMITARGNGWLSTRSLEATARFDLNVRDLGVKPPRFLVFKVDDVVSVEVRIAATAEPA